MMPIELITVIQIQQLLGPDNGLRLELLAVRQLDIVHGQWLARGLCQQHVRGRRARDEHRRVRV